VHSQPSLKPATEPPAQEQTVPPNESRSNSDREHRESPGHVSAPSERPISISRHASSRRPQGYHPDDASGVRQIYRGPDYDAIQAEYTSISSTEHPIPVERRVPTALQETKPSTEQPHLSPRPSSSTTESQASLMGHRRTDPEPARPSQTEPVAATSTGGQWPPSSGDRPVAVDASYDSGRDPNLPAAKPPASRPTMSSRVMPSAASPR